MKVLLTGAAGFIGRATAEALLKADGRPLHTR
jgi:nucleoside-diphosphate-sugar epimerase